MSNSPILVVRACMQAYVDKDRSAVERLIEDDYHFSSPLDNRIDRAAYLKICWPNSQTITKFESIYEAEHGEQALVVYEASTTSGKRFRNTEVHTVRDGKLIETEVYFGWDLPHPARQGTHKDK